MSQVKRGSQIILEALIYHGIKNIFGYPGGCVIPLFDELLNYPELNLVLVRHEQGASHAADGLARVTGKPQICLATSGPGATNCITGLATAQMDSSPLIVISGQVRRSVIGTDAFQETNVTGVSRPVTKHNYLVKDIANLRNIIDEAFEIASSGRPGPVLIDIPVDLQKETIEIKDREKKAHSKLQTYFPPEKEDIDAAWEMIAHAERPVIYAGGGIFKAEAANQLKKFADTTGIPVATTLLGQGAVPESADYALGMLGMHGTYVANMAMVHCDLAIVVGARFDDRVTGDVEEFLKQSKIIHADIDPGSLGKIKSADLEIHADAKEFLTALNKKAGKLNLEPWMRSLHQMQDNFPVPNYDETPTSKNHLRPEYVLAELSRVTKGDAIIVTDVGQHQMFTCLHYQFKHPNSHVTSGGLGTMGFSLPAAMGIAIEETKFPVISVSGDGGFQMNMQELATIRSYDIPVKILIINNSNLGMVKQWQDLFWEKRHSGVLFDGNPDFVSLGKAFDIPSYSTGDKEEVPVLMKKMLKTKGPFLLELRVETHAHVYPMIPSGEPLRNIITGPE